MLNINDVAPAYFLRAFRESHCQSTFFLGFFSRSFLGVLGFYSSAKFIFIVSD